MGSVSGKCSLRGSRELGPSVLSSCFFFVVCTSNAPVDVITAFCLSVNISDVEVVGVALEYGL